MSVYITRTKTSEDKGPFVAVSVDFIIKVSPHISATATKVLLFLAACTDKDGTCRKPLSVLAKELNISRTTLYKSLEELYPIIERTSSGIKVSRKEVEEVLQELLKRRCKRTKSSSCSKTEQSECTETEQDSVQKLDSECPETGRHYIRIYKNSRSQLSPSSLRSEEDSFARPQEAAGGRAGLSFSVGEGSSSQRKEIDPEWRASALAKAELLNNPILPMLENLSGSIPESFLPPVSIPNSEHKDDIKKAVLLRATNVICAIQRWRLRVKNVHVPMTQRDLEALGSVLSAFLHLENWDVEFETFYNWVIDNKDRYDYRLLPYYYSDWSSELLSLRRWGE